MDDVDDGEDFEEAPGVTDEDVGRWAQYEELVRRKAALKGETE